ncbi:hypothetical protein C8F04DRAFT_1204840 [Mycena alexandri]|uniref:Uncharacterized protein n=1 Tax=Mycena alexandri TaxID=1745969 RepID=A0AAD6RVC1_9AGAR|nr:hypothetical protein C8F04DRAFT_1204840 [Mycena alexandri]
MLGVWNELRYNTIPEARNLIQWMLAGCLRARAMFIYLRDYYGQNPLHLRSPGIQYLIHQQNSAQQRWLLLTTGDATPMSRRGPATTVVAGEQRLWAGAHMAPPMPPPLPPVQLTMTDMDDPMPAPSGSQEDPFELSYLGRSPPPAGGDPNDASSASASLTVALDAASRRSPRL